MFLSLFFRIPETLSAPTFKRPATRSTSSSGATAAATASREEEVTMVLDVTRRGRQPKRGRSPESSSPPPSKKRSAVVREEEEEEDLFDHSTGGDAADSERSVEKSKVVRGGNVPSRPFLCRPIELDSSSVAFASPRRSPRKRQQSASPEKSSPLPSSKGLSSPKARRTSPRKATASSNSPTPSTSSSLTSRISAEGKKQPLTRETPRKTREEEDRVRKIS